MTTASKSRTRKKTTRTQRASESKKTTSLTKISRYQRIKQRVSDYLSRRPHRSFRPTSRHDYTRSLELPGYVSFTNYVFRTITQRWRTMGLLAGVYALGVILLVGLASQEMFQIMAQTLRDTSSDIFTGGWGEVEKAGLLFASILNGGIDSGVTEAQQIYAILLFLLLWLSTVWLLRAQLAGRTPRLRDAIYSSSSPLVPTLLLALLFMIQLLPIALAAVAYSAAVSTGFLSDGVVVMVFFFVAALLALLSLYWCTSTAIALVVVTLPGMYPWQALRTAGDLVVGRRLRILLRLLWLVVVIVLAWLLVMVPVVGLSAWLQTSVSWTAFIPIVPVALLLLSSTTIIFSASYVYLLYRKVVDDDSAPA
jgi:hypothetical protein